MVVGAGSSQFARGVVEVAGRLGVEVVDRHLHPLALLEQQRAEPPCVDAHRLVSFLLRSAVAEASRRSISAGPTPSSSTILSRPVCPETSVTDVRGIESATASRRSTASFARPSSGGAVTRTFHASPWRPMMPDLPAPGETRNRNRVDVSAMRLSVVARAGN